MVKLSTFNFLLKTNSTVDTSSVVEDHAVSSTECVIDEETAVNNAGSGNVAGIGVGPNGEPGVKKTKYGKASKLDNTNLLRRTSLKEDCYLPCSVGIVGYSTGLFNETTAMEFIRQGIKQFDSVTDVVSGLTNIGIPALAYKYANDAGLKTVGIACLKALEYPCYSVDELLFIGTEWGDESEAFLNRIDGLIRVGGGQQSLNEVAMFKQLKPHAKVIEFELERTQ